MKKEDEKPHVLIANKAIPLKDTKVVWSMTGPSPMWTKWLFRITAGVTTVIVFWINGTSLVSDAAKPEVMLGLKCLDMLTLIFSNSRGRVEK